MYRFDTFPKHPNHLIFSGFMFNGRLHGRLHGRRSVRYSLIFKTVAPVLRLTQSCMKFFFPFSIPFCSFHSFRSLLSAHSCEIRGQRVC